MDGEFQLTLMILRHSARFRTAEAGVIIKANMMNPEDVTPGRLKTLLIKAVTDWMLEGGEEARRMWTYAGDDFNIGDLAMCYDQTEGTLQKFFAKYGIQDIQIESLPENPSDWVFDSLLLGSPLKGEIPPWVKS